MSQPLSSRTYLQIARTLPRPSPLQCDRFIHHVAAAQRWYRLLPIDSGVACVLFLNPHAGRQLARVHAGRVTFRDAERPSATEQYRAAFGYLDYATPAARSPSTLLGSDLGLPQPDSFYVLDADERAVALPAELLAVAGCSLNATIYPNVATLLESLPLRVSAPLGAPGATEALEPIRADAELRLFAEEYVREELAGFQCPDDRAAWEMRQLQAFQQLYMSRHAAQLASLRGALEGMLSWVYDR